MSTPRVARAAELAAELRGAGVEATADVQQLQTRLPAVLVPPPRIVFDGYGLTTLTWRLVAVASTPDQLRAWEQIDQLVEQLSDALPVELAEPVSFAATPGSDPLPAYAVTFTDTLEP